MATRYHLYINAGGGPDDPIDYTTPVADTADLTADVGPLDAPGDYRIGIRAYDDVSELEETNVDAVVRLRIAADGSDLTALPNAPGDLAATDRGGGTVRLAWTYTPEGQGGAPTAFKVWATAGDTPDYDDPPEAVVAYAARLSVYEATIDLTAGAEHTLAVRATNATGDEPNTTATVTLTPADAGPAAVTGATAAPAGGAGTS